MIQNFQNKMNKEFKNITFDQNSNGNVDSPIPDSMVRDDLDKPLPKEPSKTINQATIEYNEGSVVEVCQEDADDENLNIS